MIEKKAIPHICSSESQFLRLKGDGSESVKVTLDFHNPSSLNGWYLFLKTDSQQNSFVRQNTTNIPHIDRIFSETKYFQFDRNAGLILDSYHYNYSPIGVELESNREEYARLQKLLEEVGEWKAVEQVLKWEFK